MNECFWHSSSVWLKNPGTFWALYSLWQSVVGMVSVLLLFIYFVFSFCRRCSVVIIIYHTFLCEFFFTISFHLFSVLMLFSLFIIMPCWFVRTWKFRIISVVLLLFAPGLLHIWLAEHLILCTVHLNTMNSTKMLNDFHFDVNLMFVKSKLT